MNLVDYNVLNNIWTELQRELADLDDAIKYNNCCIEEAERYVQSLIGSEPEDFKVFSPRNVESTHKEEIKKTYLEKSDCEEKNKILSEKRKTLCERIMQLEDVLQNRNQNLTVLKIQEEDRQRIARDLHDTSLQNLTHLIHKIELSSLYVDKDPTKAKLELSVVNKILRETIDEIRSTIFNLRPMTFDDLGLRTAFETLISEINENQKYVITSDIEDVSCENNLVLVSIYRIVQECLNNIDKHAEAEKVSFSCKNCNDSCVIDITDDGKGFDSEDGVKENHFGLSLMRERIKLLNGTVAISSKEGQGTNIHIEIPLNIYQYLSER